MNGWEIAMLIVFLILADVWLFWYAWKGERERFERERMRRKGLRHRAYPDIFRGTKVTSKTWEDKKK